MSENIKREELGNMLFAQGYSTKYRYFKQKLLENEYDTVQEVLHSLKDEQYDNLRQMIEIEMKINAVQYCSELATIAICVKNKKTDKIIQVLSSMSETAIHEFYDNFITMNNGDISKYMGYHEIKIKSQDEFKKYDRSCDRFKNDIIKISKFFKTHFQLYLAYKHGLRIIPAKNDKGQKLIIEACDDNTMTLYEVPEMWYLDTIEITEIINNIYEKLYIPIFRKKLEVMANISLKDKSLQCSIQSTDPPGPPDPKRPLVFSTSMKLPWWVHDGKEPNPFY